MTIHTPEDLAAFRKLGRTADEYEGSVKDMLDALPGRIHALLSQEWASSIPPDKHKVVTRQLTEPYGQHWQAIQMVQQKAKRLQNAPKIQDRIRNDVMKDYSEIYHMWKHFDIQAPKMLQQYVTEAPIMTFQEAVKHVSDNKMWKKGVRFSLVFRPRDADSVWVWHSQTEQEYFISLEHVDRFWDRGNSRGLTPDESMWDAKLGEKCDVSEWKAAPAFPEARNVEVGSLETPFLNPDGKKQTNASIIMCRTNMDVGASSEGQITDEEAKTVFNSYVCHNIRIANEFRFLEDTDFEKLMQAFPGMLGDTSINVFRIMQKLLNK